MRYVYAEDPLGIVFVFFFFFNDTATTEIYTLSLHDALPICCFLFEAMRYFGYMGRSFGFTDRKSTRLNSSHRCISYAVFCLKKKNKQLSTLQEDVKQHFGSAARPDRQH